MGNNIAKNVICPKCKKAMRLDDIDFNFKGNQDEYYLCDDCEYSAFIKIRYYKECQREFFDENGVLIN